MKPATSKIDALDLSEIKRKLTMPPDKGGYGWPDKETDEAITGYRQYLKDMLNYRTREGSGGGSTDQHSASAPRPSHLIDIVWHSHILFTKKYHRDCEEIFGEYLHHLPDLDAQDS